MKISVVVPAYNAGRFLGRALQSVLSQTEDVFETIVVDDGSTDETGEVAKSFGDHVTYIRQTNGGPAKARNAAISASGGDWIAFLDADDWWAPEKIALQSRAAADNDDAVLVYSGVQFVDEEGKQQSAVHVDAATLWPQLRWRNPIAPSCVMVKREAILAIGGFDENLWGCEDWAAWVKLMRVGRFVSIPEVVTYYRVVPTSLSSNADHMLKDFLKMLDSTLISDLNGIRRASWRRRILSYQSYGAALNMPGSDLSDGKLRFVLRSLKQWPSPFWQPRRYITLLACLRQQLRQGITERKTSLCEGDRTH